MLENPESLLQAHLNQLAQYKFQQSLKLGNDTLSEKLLLNIWVLTI